MTSENGTNLISENLTLNLFNGIYLLYFFRSVGTNTEPIEQHESHYNPRVTWLWLTEIFCFWINIFQIWSHHRKNALTSLEKTSSAVFILFKDEKECNLHTYLILVENHPLYIEVYSTVFWEINKKRRTPELVNIICIRESLKYFMHYFPWSSQIHIRQGLLLFHFKDEEQKL